MSRKELMSDIVMARKELSIDRLKKILRVCLTITRKAY
jgi:hypothetical protein